MIDWVVPKIRFSGMYILGISWKMVFALAYTPFWKLNKYAINLAKKRKKILNCKNYCSSCLYSISAHGIVSGTRFVTNHNHEQSCISISTTYQYRHIYVNEFYAAIYFIVIHRVQDNYDAFCLIGTVKDNFVKINALASFKMTRQFSQIPHAFSGAK